MEIKKLAQMQYDFDKEHGWISTENNIKDLIDVLSKDLIGLMGEIGEFANIIKKLNLEEKILTKEEYANKYQEYQPLLEEELIDTFIYIIRIATYMGIDLEYQYLKKLEKNKERFQRYENSDENE